MFNYHTFATFSFLCTPLITYFELAGSGKLHPYLDPGQIRGKFSCFFFSSFVCVPVFLLAVAYLGTNVVHELILLIMYPEPEAQRLTYLVIGKGNPWVSSS